MPVHTNIESKCLSLPVEASHMPFWIPCIGCTPDLKSPTLDSVQYSVGLMCADTSLAPIEMKRAFHDHLGSSALERGREEKKRGTHTELELRLRRPWGEWYTAAEPFNEKGIPCRVRPVYIPPEDRKKGRGPFLFKRESDVTAPA